MNNSDVINIALDRWRRRIQQTAQHLDPPQTGPVHEALVPVLEQLVAVYNLAGGLVDELRQSSDLPLATTSVGRDFLTQLAAALAHTHRAASHLSTTVTGLTDAHRLAPRPGTPAPAESRLSITLGHAAALRSLQRALAAVTAPVADTPPTTACAPASTVAEQHGRAAANDTRPVRRR